VHEGHPELSRGEKRRGTSPSGGERESGIVLFFNGGKRNLRQLHQEKKAGQFVSRQEEPAIIRTEKRDLRRGRKGKDLAASSLVRGKALLQNPLKVI